MDDTDFYLQVPSLFNITQIFWSSEDRVKARFYSVESRQNKPKANHRNLLSTEHTENTEKIKVKETLWGRCSSAFSSLIYLLWYALGLYYQERIIKKNYAKSEIKISIIKLNNIKYWIKTAKTLAFRGCHVVSLCFKPRMISKTRKKPLNQKNQINNLTTKKTLMFTKKSNSTRHLVPTERPRFPDRFSFGSR